MKYLIARRVTYSLLHVLVVGEKKEILQELNRPL